MLLKQIQYDNVKKQDELKKNFIEGNYVPKQQRDARKE
jgi:hypothetical protein